MVKARVVIVIIAIYICGCSPVAEESALPTIAVLPTLTATVEVPSPTATPIPPSATVTATNTPEPSSTSTFTPSPTVTNTAQPTDSPPPTPTPSNEEHARNIINDTLAGEDLERLSVLDVGSPKYLAVDYPMPGLLSPNISFTGREMLKLACALYAAGFNDDWNFQFSAMIDVVNKANGQTSRRDGLTTRVSAATVSSWDCNNIYSMDAKLAMDDYKVDPLLQN